jgi:hypothetical protein
MLGRKGQISPGRSVKEIFNASKGIIFILAFLLLTGTYVIFGFSDRGDFYEKQVLANEVGLMIDAIQLFPENAEVHLTVNNSYGINVSSYNVSVGNRQGYRHYFYFEDRDRTVVPANAIGNKLSFYLEGGIIQLENNKRGLRDVRSCPVGTPILAPTIPANNDVTEIITRVTSFPGNWAGPVSLGIGRSDKTIVYYSAQPALACHIAAKLGAGLVPINTEWLAQDNPATPESEADKRTTDVYITVPEGDDAQLAKKIYEGIKSHGLE